MIRWCGVRKNSLVNKPDKAEEVYECFFEHGHSIMLIVHPENGNLLDANETACAFYGYTKKELLCMRIMDINTLPEEKVHKEMQRAKATKREVFNFQHRLANGEIRDVEVFSGPIVLGGETVLYSIIYDISERKEYEREREQLIARLEQALAEIKTLRGILPICVTCKKIRDDKGYWNQIESYISHHSEAEFSHGICPDCAQTLYPNLKSSYSD